MQDRSAGDVGDFAKFGLLRALSTKRRIGIAWYLHPDSGPAGDGRHTDYLRTICGGLRSFVISTVSYSMQ